MIGFILGSRLLEIGFFPGFPDPGNVPLSLSLCSYEREQLRQGLQDGVGIEWAGGVWDYKCEGSVSWAQGGTSRCRVSWGTKPLRAGKTTIRDTRQLAAWIRLKEGSWESDIAESGWTWAREVTQVDFEDLGGRRVCTSEQTIRHWLEGISEEQKWGIMVVRAESKQPLKL